MPKPNFQKYLIALTLILGVMLGVLGFFVPKLAINYLHGISLLYFFVLTWVTFKVASSGVAKDNKTFVTRIYGAIGIRFIFSLFPLLIYLIFMEERVMSFIIAYLLLYLFYTAFEIYFLVINLRPDLNKKDPS